VITLAQLSIGVAGLWAVLMGGLAALYAVNPALGLAKTAHHGAELPRVMGDRYLAFAVLALGAAWHGDPVVIAFLFAVFALMGLADAAIYARAGKPFWPHLAAGAVSAGLSLVAFLAPSNGAA
jgi:hypothetical protein